MPFRVIFPPSLGELRATARVELLAAWFHKWLGESVEAEVAPSYGELEARLLAAEAELFWAPPVLCAEVEDSARAILKAVRSGRAAYRAALVGRRDDGLTLESLSGTRAAWVDRLSASGYRLPTAYLREAGLEPDRVFESQRFLGSFRSALEAVIGLEADVAPVHVSSQDEEAVEASMAECMGRDRSQLAPIAFTGEAPSDGLVFTSKMSEADVEALLEKLVPFLSGSRGPNLLLEVFRAERLERAQKGDYAVLSRTG
jgi:phosphonate transport system substrate-binding protein